MEGGTAPSRVLATWLTVPALIRRPSKLRVKVCV